MYILKNNLIKQNLQKDPSAKFSFDTYYTLTCSVNYVNSVLNCKQLWDQDYLYIFYGHRARNWNSLAVGNTMYIFNDK